MSRPCRLQRAGKAVDARWRREADTLVIAPASGPALAIALGEVAGIGGDGFSITLRAPAGDVTLDRLGADGPTLLQELRRDWPGLRAGLLRLTGGETPAKLFAGTVASPRYRGTFRGFVLDEKFIFAPEGADLLTLFLADCSNIAFDDQAYAVRCAGWEGEETVFTKVGADTTAFTAALQGAHDALVLAAEATMALYLPTLKPAPRADLGSQWLPGRVLSFAELEQIAPGFEAAFMASWLAACPRVEEGRKLMAGVAPTARFLGYAATDEVTMLWLLVRRDDDWSLELLSQDDYATYLFAGGAELPALIAGIVRLAEFSREALYLPLAELTEERAKYAIAARDLPLLRELRARFRGRRIHPPRL
jgi:hypothetical protein